VAALVLRAVVSLGLVLLLMAGLARLARRRFGTPGAAARGAPVTIEVLARQGLAKNASVAVVRAGGHELVLGVTDHTVTVLAQGGAPVEHDATPAEAGAVVDIREARTATLGGSDRPAPAWKALIEQAQERTVRRT